MLSTERIHGASPLISFKGPFIFFLLLFIAELSALLLLNHGLLIFTLDDPYIHLALAENLIEHGHYGVNFQEPSAPSSSILWPFLIAPFSASTFAADWIILLFNLICASTTFWIQYQIIQYAFSNDSTTSLAQPSTAVRVGAYGFLFTLIPISNSVGLIFTGMEHSLQVLLAHLVFLGLVEEKLNKTLPKYLLIALLLGPLIRYESLALSAPTLFYLFIRGYRLPSFFVGLILLMSLMAFSLFLNLHDLGLMPNSIAAKSANITASNPSILERINANLYRNIRNPMGWLLLLVLGASLPLLIRKSTGTWRWVFTIFFCAALAHFIFGSLWWYGRYETYIYSSLVLALLFGYRHNLIRFLSRTNALISTVVLSAPLIFLSLPSIFILVTTPQVSNWIYIQPYHFHKFVTEYYPHPVAVNDLGWVSRGNDQYILDLWGLASRDALACRKTKNKECYQTLTDKHDVHLAILTESWYADLPDNWVKVASYDCGYPLINSMDGVCTVGFYATDKRYLAELQSVIGVFEKTLPKPAKLILMDINTGTSTNN